MIIIIYLKSSIQISSIDWLIAVCFINNKLLVHTFNTLIFRNNSVHAIVYTLLYKKNRFIHTTHSDKFDTHHPSTLLDSAESELAPSTYHKQSHYQCYHSSTLKVIINGCETIHMWHKKLIVKYGIDPNHHLMYYAVCRAAIYTGNLINIA